MKTTEIGVSAIHDVKGAGFRREVVEDVHIVRLSFCDADKTRDGAAQGQKSVHFDGGFCLAKSRPGKERKAEVDGGGIEGVGDLVEFQDPLVVGIQASGVLNQGIGEIGEDAPVSLLVGVGERTPGDLSPDARVVEFGFHGAQTGLDLAQTFAAGQLGKCHAEKLVEAGKTSHATIALIA